MANIIATAQIGQPLLIGGIAAAFVVLVLVFYSRKRNAGKDQPVAAATNEPVRFRVVAAEGQPTMGSLRLTDVDEKTAAIIMAIVADECGIPLEQLIFKSIKAV